MIFSILFACLSFNNQFSVDADEDGFSMYDGDCNDKDPNVTPTTCGDLDNDGKSLDEEDCDDSNPDINKWDNSEDETVCLKDQDRDGYGDENISTEIEGLEAGTDCDDLDGDVFPNAPELCDGKDNDCNGIIDDPIVSTTELDENAPEMEFRESYLLDVDEDGFGDITTLVYACNPTHESTSYVGVPSVCEGLDPLNTCSRYIDCDDNNSSINPSMTEICDGIDNDCDSNIDDDDSGVDSTTGSVFYRDLDGDSFGSSDNTKMLCEIQDGYVENAEDCSDKSDDLNGDGILDSSLINPVAQEICDGIDNDCDSNIDDNDSDVDLENSGTLFYLDTDGDNYGSPASSARYCSAPSNFVDNNEDCDDADNQISPESQEICDGIDNNCDGNEDEISEALPGTLGAGVTYFLDADGDTFGNTEITMYSCSQPDGYVQNASDCDDSNSNIFPSTANNSEICDGVDNNCDGLIDDSDPHIDNATKSTFYLDADGDFFGEESSTTEACDLPEGYADNADDCDDSLDIVNPNANEDCDGVDNNCDGILHDDEIDNDGDSAVECDLNTPWYGDSLVKRGDCDDNDATAYIGADLFVPTECRKDTDGDGYGDSNPENENISAGDDCDDTQSVVRPGALELCDGVLNDCETIIPSNQLAPNDEIDNDGDGYVECLPLFGEAWLGETVLDENGSEAPPRFSDCDDTEPSIFPNATELCDGLPNNCNAIDWSIDTISSDEIDDDNDGYVDCSIDISPENWRNGEIIGGDDCDDTDEHTYVGRAYLENPTSCMRDMDLDGYGDQHVPENVTTGSDCDDANVDIYPAAIEYCDGFFNNCDNPLWSQITLPVDEQDADLDGYVSCALDVDPSDWPEVEIVGGLDCDDSDSLTLSSIEDADCDQLIDSDDCDDQIPDDIPQIFDRDCDGILDRQFDISGDMTMVINDYNELVVFGYAPWSPHISPYQAFRASTYLRHGCFIDNQREIQCWGQELYGKSTPPLNLGKIRDISVGLHHSCALMWDHSIECWGLDNEGQSTPPLGNQFIAIEAGENHTCALKENKELVCWGGNEFWQGSAISGLFDEFSVGDLHNCGIDPQGEATCWGANYVDIDKDGISEYTGQSDAPTIPLQKITSGRYHSCALDEDGEILCWGDNTFGQTDSPVGNFIELISGSFHTCALDDADNWTCWGDNTFGQLSPSGNLDFDEDGLNIFEDADDKNTLTTSRDADGDGYFIGSNVAASDVDCDDQNPYRYPNAPEYCGNNLDDNCDGIDDSEIESCVSPTADFPVDSTYTACSWADLEASNGDNTIEQYKWSIESNEDNPFLRFSEQNQTPQVFLGEVGTYDISLEVANSNYWSSTTTKEVTVTETRENNSPEVIVSDTDISAVVSCRDGIDCRTCEPTLVELHSHVSITDVDNEPLSYLWYQDSDQGSILEDETELALMRYDFLPIPEGESCSYDYIQVSVTARDCSNDFTQDSYILTMSCCLD